MPFLRSDTAPRHVRILVLPGFSNLTLAALMEPLRVANRLDGRTLFEWSIVTPDGAPVASRSGVRIEADMAMAAVRPGEPGLAEALFVVAAYDVEDAITPELRGFIRAAARAGAVIGGLESGTYAMASAGVLDGYRATTHWEDLQDLADRFPRVDVRPDRFVIDRNRLSSGGALPTLDLMLDLFRRDFGLSLAMAVSSAFIYEQEHAGHDPQHMRAAGRLSWQDPALVRAIRLMERNIEHPLSVEAIAEAVELSPRELLRRFRTRLATSPKSYYAELRLTVGRRLLEHTDHPLGMIALMCGFGSGSAFARAFRARFGNCPTMLRRTGGL
jgi:transcriptional regulator GlxA family with amidase domain